MLDVVAFTNSVMREDDSPIVIAQPFAFCLVKIVLIFLCAIIFAHSDVAAGANLGPPLLLLSAAASRSFLSLR